jgi:tetratricopeptide (TPR) repeat protein
MALINISLTEEEKAKENINLAGQNGYPIYSEDSFLQLANAYNKVKNYQKLVEVYQELIKIKPSEPRYHSSLATVYKEIGQFEKAREEAQIVLKLAPQLKEEVEEFLKTIR